MTSANFAFSTVPVKVITPSATDTVTPVIFFFFNASLTVPSSILSGDTGAGVGSGLSVQLFVTDLMPSTDLTEASALLLTVTSATSPVSVATPSLTATVTPVTLSAVSLSVAAFVRSASLLPHALINRATASIRTVKNLTFILPPEKFCLLFGSIIANTLEYRRSYTKDTYPRKQQALINSVNL